MKRHLLLYFLVLILLLIAAKIIYEKRDVEESDAQKVGMAIRAIEQKDLSKARSLLKEVVANTPKNYVYSYEDEGKLFIKFWDQEEFSHFVKESSYQGDKKISWKRGAYPRAYFELAYIDVEEGKYESALASLQAALRLEPDQPKSFIEMAVIYDHLGKRDRALSLYDQALQVRRYITPDDKARALRGKGIILIDLGQIDLAENCLKESLKYDPDNEKAFNELVIIFALRSNITSEPGPRGSIVRAKRK